MQMGIVLVAEQKYKEAEEIFRKVYDLNPANAAGLLGMTEVMMAEKQPERAQQALRTEIQKYPTRQEFHLALGNLLVRAGKFDQGIAEFTALLDKADRKSATAADLYIRLGETHILNQNLPGAIYLCDLDSGPLGNAVMTGTGRAAEVFDWPADENQQLWQEDG